MLAHKKNDDSDPIDDFSVVDDFDLCGQFIYELLRTIAIITVVVLMVIGCVYVTYVVILVEMIPAPLTALANAIVGQVEMVLCNLSNPGTCLGAKLPGRLSLPT